MKKFTLLSLFLLLCGITGVKAQTLTAVVPEFSDENQTREYFIHSTQGNGKGYLLNTYWNTTGNEGNLKVNYIDDLSNALRVKLVGTAEGFQMIPMNVEGHEDSYICSSENTSGKPIRFLAEPNDYSQWILTLKNESSKIYYISLKENTNLSLCFMTSTQTRTDQVTTLSGTNNANRWQFYDVLTYLESYVENARENATKLGYPSTTSQVFKNLETAIATYKNDVTAENYNAVISAHNAYKTSTTDVKVPVANGIYRISGVIFSSTKDMYAGGEPENMNLLWGNADAGKNSHYWNLVGTDGNLKMKNGNGYYVKAANRTGNQNGSDMFTMTPNENEASSATISPLGGGQFSITFGNSNPTHAKDHSEGGGSSGEIIAWEGGQNSASSWKFDAIANYNLYNVSITTPNGEAATLTRTETEETTLDGGFFVLPTGETFSESEFSAPHINGYVTKFVIDNDSPEKTITVTYEYDMKVEFNDAYDEAVRIANLDGPGYPVKEGNSAYDALRSKIEELASIRESESPMTDHAVIEALQEKVNSYKSSADIQKPQVGKAYTMKGVDINDHTFYMYYTANGYQTTAVPDNGVLPATSIFICCKADDEGYAFANNAGKYFIWKGKGGKNDNKGYKDAYDATYSVVQLKPFVGQFGFLYMVGKRYDNPENATLVFNNGVNGGFNANSGDNKTFNSTHTSRLLIEEVSYPNTPALKNIESVVMAVGTFSAPFPTVVPAEVKAYYVAADAIDNSTAKLTRIPEGEAIPANQGVILAAAMDATSALMVPATSEIQGDLTGNLLKPSGDGFAKETYDDANTTVYVLSGHENKVAFYRAGANTSLGANKAYLEITGGAAPSLVMNFGGETTGIESIVTENADKTVYDLSGRRIQNPTKGLYIIGGKKVYIK